MTTAAALNSSMRLPDGADRRDGNPGAIYAVVMDEHNVHCLTEAMLDAWWESLPPQDKAAFYEYQMDLFTDGVIAGLRHPLNAVVAGINARQPNTDPARDR